MTPELLSAVATSTVNLAEVHGKLVGRGLDPVDAATLSPIREDVAFSSEHARLRAIWPHKPARMACQSGTACLARSNVPQTFPCPGIKPKAAKTGIVRNARFVRHRFRPR